MHNWSVSKLLGTLLSLLFLACGGGGGAPAPTPTTPAWRITLAGQMGASPWITNLAFADGQAPGVVWTDTTHSCFAGKLNADGAAMSQAELVHADPTFTSVSGFVMGPGGRQMAVWVNSAGQTVTREYSPTSGWDASTSQVGTTSPGYLIGLAYDDQGNAFAAFAKAWVDVSFSVSVKAPGMPWGTPTQLGNVPGVENPVRLLVAPGGHAALVWQQTYIGSEGLWARVYTPGSGWGAGQLLTASTTLSSSLFPGCVGADGALYAGVVHHDYTNYSSELRVLRYHPSSGWSGPSAPASSGTGYGDLLMAPLPDGKLLILWASAGRPGLTGAELSGGTWSSPAPYLLAPTVECRNPQVEVSSKGVLLFSWRSAITGTTYENVFAALREGGTTSREVTLGPDQQRDALIKGLGFDAKGVPTVVGYSDEWYNGALVGRTWIAQYR